MSQPTNHSDPIELLAEEFLDRRRRGERVSVDDYAAAYPDRAEEIRELFPTIVALEEVKPGEEPQEKPAFDCPDQLGDLRILREIGRGGMGVVYEAMQESLGRRVAVKVLPGRTLFDTKQLERFRREARTAAALAHPNIVPIYSVGEQDGLHYLVMQKIDGAGLDVLTRRVGKRTKSGAMHDSSLSLASDETLAMGLEDGLAEALVKGTFDLPAGKPSSSADTNAEGSRDAMTVAFSGNSSLSGAVRATSLGLALADQDEVNVDALSDEYYQSVAKIGAQAAEALAYAHTQGVLHRDIKPGNLLLDKSGRVWVTDFGLAKAVGQADVSRTGELLGTLRYMSPEQLRGQATARSDLYALGVTLYELVTFRSPFDAPTPSEVLHKINEHRPERPSKLNRRLPGDLEKIVLRAMAADPDERYATGEELAADLRRFLDAKPIASPRTKPIATFQRWLANNRVAALFATLALMLGGTTVAAIAFWPGPEHADQQNTPPVERLGDQPSPSPEVDRPAEQLRDPGPPPRDGRPPRGRRPYDPPFGPPPEERPYRGPRGPRFDDRPMIGPLGERGDMRRGFRRGVRERLGPPPERSGPPLKREE